MKKDDKKLILSLNNPDSRKLQATISQEDQETVAIIFDTAGFKECVSVATKIFEGSGWTRNTNNGVCTITGRFATIDEAILALQEAEIFVEEIT